MSDNSLVPVKLNLPAVLKKDVGSNALTVINYEKTDPQHYSFTYTFDDDVHFRMDEAEHSTDRTDFVEAEYDDSVPESAKVYYAVAAASGILTGAISMLHLSEEQMKSIEELKEKDWKPIIIKLANVAGYKKSDYKGASGYLVNRAVRVAKTNDKAKESLTILAEHPTLVGLVFSILNQYSGKAFSLSETGELKTHALPKYYTVGDTNAEKIVCAVFYWLFALACEEAENKRRILDDIGISNDLLKKIKEFANFPFVKNIPENRADAEEKFSEWLRQTIVGAKLYDEENEAESSNRLFALMGVVLNIAEDAFPVLINECIVRGLYILIRLCHVVSEKQIQSFDELKAISPSELLPFDDRILSKMCLIASASFAGANIAGATLKAIKDKKVNNRKFSDTFFAELNIAGIGRFLFACASDSKYWGDDIRILLQKSSKTSKKNQKAQDAAFEEETSFDPLVLDALQARILYCLENISVRYDIAHTEKAELAEKKGLWLETWRKFILRSIGASDDLTEQYFVEDEDLLYKGIFALSQDKANWRWFYLLTQELALFKPYIPLGTADDKSFKKLKADSDYVTDQFVRRQTIVSQSEVDDLQKVYNKYTGYVSGSTQNKIIGVSAAAVAAVATGGVALTFAPGIAAAIAGEAVAGLHGIALTNASLAFIGGGSLAAGGLGVAGGTAIITGGGALLGLAGTGGVSAAAVLLQTPSEYWVRQSAKLLTYCNCVLRNNMQDSDAVKAILHQVDGAIDKMEKDVKLLEDENNDLDKEMIKKMSGYVKYLKKCRSELQKLAA